MYRFLISIVLALTTALSYGSEMTVSVKAGTLGIVVGTTQSLSNKVNLRVEFSESVAALGFLRPGYDQTGALWGRTYHYRQQTLGPVMDWRPFEGRFHMSAGLLLNNNHTYVRADANCNQYGQAVPCTYNINGHLYSATQVSEPQGKLSYRYLAPYVGLGWGFTLGRNKKWVIAYDLGALYQGTPTVTFDAAGNVPGLQADLAAERARIAKDNPPWLPVVSLGIGYKW